MIRRLKNLWYLSGLNISFNKITNTLIIDEIPIKITKRNKQADIIDLIDPLDKIEI